MAEYSRPASGYRYKGGGMKVNSVADNVPIDKYPAAQNVRWYSEGSARTRAGLTLLGSTNITSPAAITDMRDYSALGTDNFPQAVVRRADDQVWAVTPLSAITNLGTLAGGGKSPGATLIPFRPDQSPAPYMYIANGNDYQKFLAASPGHIATQSKVGIAEPQAPPDAAIIQQFQNLFNVGGGAGSFTPGGTTVGGTVVSGNRVTDTVGAVFPDPAGGIGAVQSLFVSPSQNYSRYMVLSVNSNLEMVNDVFPLSSVPIQIFGIFYFSGIIGRCVIVPQGLTSGPGNQEESLFTQAYLAGLRRGAIITVGNGLGTSEFCYVLGVSVGPDGNIAIETITVNPHFAGETMLINDAVQVIGPAAVGNSILSPTVALQVTVGVGTITQTISNFFVTSLHSYQPDDYIHFSVKIDDLTRLTEMKILFDVGDGSFTQNFYYYTVRPSDITFGIANTLTQLGAAQLVSQRAIIDEELAAMARNQGKTASSSQTSPGSAQWSEIMFPISALTRVGNDQAKNLQTANAIQFLFNCTNTINASINSISVFGGFQSDCGPTGAPYRYRLRPRASTTGAKGNPSPATRYSVSARRQAVGVITPTTYPDPQVDTWDVFRYGGTVTSWRKIGQVSLGTTFFQDQFDDDAALAGEVLDFDNLEPWPTIDVPYVLTANVVGTTATVTVPSPTNILRLLPGNIVRLSNGNAYTIWTRPTLVSGTTYLLQFLENAGVVPSTALMIYEPEIANQHLPYMWGPDSEGTMFACGDPLRLGTVYFAKNNNPDSAPDTYSVEIVPPSEPLLGGAIVDGLSFVASTERWWALYPQPQNPLQRYSFVPQPLPRGLAAPLGRCTDGGKTLFWWAKDGIWSSTKGSLTDADLYTLFPHEGVPGVNYSYGTFNAYAPDYSRAGTFRLAFRNYFLYATYQDTTGAPRCLTLDTRTGAWTTDVHPAAEVTCVYGVEQQTGTLLANGAPYPYVLMGDVNGAVYKETDLTNDNVTPISCIIATTEWDGGDIRASEQWGDAILDCTPAAVAGVTVTPMARGAGVVTPTVLASNPNRVQSLVSLGGGLLTNYLGYLASWTDDFTQQAGPTTLHVWQPSYIDKPEMIADRFTDWDDAGSEGAKFWQGFVMRADTFNAVKGLVVRDSDTQTLHAFTPTVQHNGESIRAYSFNTPFIAHQCRMEPSLTDGLPWRYFETVWVTEPTPETAETWQTQGTAFGLIGYMHVKMLAAAYAATQPVTLTITSYDGQSPAPINLPATGGAYRKTLFMLSPNKGQLYFFQGTSSAPWQAYLRDWDIYVGAWGRSSQYLIYKNIGGQHGDKARI